jgi:rod shape-determining protein MreC
MNLNETQRRIRWVTFIILIGITFLLVVLDTSGSLDSALNFLEDPLAAVMGWTTERSDAFAITLTGPEDLQMAQAELEQLRLQVDMLQRENEELREIQGEYQTMLALFDRARETPEFTRMTAKVIGYDSSPLFRSMILDRGSDDGIQVGMPVESSRGLVGQVYRTTNQAAMVLLLTDNISSIPVRLGESRATGIARGGGLGGAMTMDWIDLEQQIEVGDVVYTSGLGGRFPQDMVIGRLSDVERREADLFQKATIQPAVDFEALEMVFVITDYRTIDTSIFDTLPEELSRAP